MQGLSLVAATGGHSSSQCTGLSLSQPHLLQSTGSRRTASAIVVHGPSRSVACGIFPDQGLNPCPLHCQADSQPLRHQGSPDYRNGNFACYLFPKRKIFILTYTPAISRIQFLFLFKTNNEIMTPSYF